MQNLTIEQTELAALARTDFWSQVKADAIANGRTFSYQRTIKLLLFHSGFQLLVAFRMQQRLRQFGPISSFLADLLLKFATEVLVKFLWLN